MMRNRYLLNISILFNLILFTALLPAMLYAQAEVQTQIAVEDSLSLRGTDSLENSLTVLPAIFYTPETKLGFGIYPNYIFYFSPDCNPSNLSFLGYYTIKKQISISFDPSLYFGNDNYFLSGTLYFTKWPDQFFGFGTGVSKDDAEDYTIKNSGIYLEFERKLVSRFYAGVAYELDNTKFLEREEAGRLANGSIPGSNGGLNAGTGAIINWDGRDNIFFPGTGEYLSVNPMAYGREWGGDFTYNRLIIDLRKYYSPRQNNVIAMQVFGRFINGDAPFREYSQVGQAVRGYLPALYIEKKLIAVQLEYRRVPLWGRFGATVFAGTGSVARAISDFRNSRYKFAAGLGLRYIMVEDEKFNIRIDYGIGDDSAELYLAVGEAF